MKQQSLLRLSVALAVCCVVFVDSSYQPKAADEVQANPDSAVARVLEFNVPPEINRPDNKIISIDMFLTYRDTLTLTEGVYVTLVLRDGTVSRFDGPATISLSSAPDRREGSVVARLTSAILSLFFSASPTQEEAYLGVRHAATSRIEALRFPKVLYPPSGCSMVMPPRQLRWQPVEGILSYTVSLFDSHELLWQEKASSASIELPRDDSLVRPGMTYLWVVEAQVGDRIFRSKQAVFSVLDATTMAGLNRHLLEINESVADPKLKHLLRARLYRELDLLLESYGEIESLLQAFPQDYTASVINAELLEEMGLFQEAVKAYRTIVHR